MKKLTLVVSLVVAAWVSMVVEAGAVERKGFVIGLGGGVGETRTENGSNTAIASEFHIGGMLGPRTALLVESSAITDREEDFTFGIGVVALAVQHWFNEKGWAKGGVGSGFVFVSGQGESEWEDAGLGFLAAVGYEALQRDKFTLDLQGRFTTSSGVKEGVRVNNFSAAIGVNWW